MRFIYSIVLISLFSCSNHETDKSNSTESIVALPESDSNKTVTENSIVKPQPAEPISLPSPDTTGLSERKEQMKKAKIDIVIFRNTDISGFGYDIILEGKTYVHQPNIPALPGNNGFANEEKARKVAELVKYKISNNIMPPTVEVKELDSLGIR